MARRSTLCHNRQLENVKLENAKVSVVTIEDVPVCQNMHHLNVVHNR